MRPQRGIENAATLWTGETLTGVERTFGADEIIVSKTDLKGRITYANQVFLRVARYSEEELLGKPHNLIRHPHMPRGVFRLLWDTIQGGEEVFAYVLNRTKHGDHYWVFAHVTPSFDAMGRMQGFHSSRRVAARSAVKEISKLYEAMRKAEKVETRPRDAGELGKRWLEERLRREGVSYGEYVFSLARGGADAPSTSSRPL